MANTQYYPNPIADGNVMLTWAQSTVVNLANPSAPSSVNFAVPYSEPGTYTIVNVTMESEELINALIGAAALALNLGDSFSSRPGVYNADVARLMALYASWTRGGTDVGDYYILGPIDVYNLLAQDPAVQEIWVNATLNASGYEGVSGLNGIPLVQQGISQFLAPDKDAFKAQLPPGSKVTGVEDLPNPEGLETVGAGEKEESKWWLYGGIAAAGVAAYTVYAMTKRGRR